MLEDLLQAMPQLRPQIYFKSSLTALSHAMEDQILAGADRALVIACFQRERFYRQEAHRYRRIGTTTDQLYVMAAPETEFKSGSDVHETVAFEPSDGLANEWHLLVLAEQYACCLVCRESNSNGIADSELNGMDQARRFEGIWTFDRLVCTKVGELLLERVRIYRPELDAKIDRAFHTYNLGVKPDSDALGGFQNVDPGPFAQRLVTYLQAGQHKLLKTYRSIAAQERRERSINSITTAIRQSLNPADIFQVAVRELGQALDVCRCLIYRCKESDATATIDREYLGASVPSLAGQTWPLQDNPLFREVVEALAPVAVENALTDRRIANSKTLQTLMQEWQIGSWLMVPVLYKNQVVGMVELHQCGCDPRVWDAEELTLVDAIATQVGVALIQAEAYANLEGLNQQLEALDRTRSNLIAIAGHELRTPLSTIQVCLESLSSDPDMPAELRQVMLSTALDDAERMRTLVQDFLTLSRLESGRVEWNPEPLPLLECVELALSSIRTRANSSSHEVPEISTHLPDNLPLVRADGEWLVEVLSKLLDNACKFTPAEGEVRVEAQLNRDRFIQVSISDTGRGIPPDRLEAVFDRFYQEEGALRRSTGGTGLGLAICRQIVHAWGGTIWATSEGKNQGSQFHFTIPIDASLSDSPSPSPNSPKSTPKSRRGDRSSRGQRQQASGKRK